MKQINSLTVKLFIQVHQNKNKTSNFHFLANLRFHLLDTKEGYLNHQPCYKAIDNGERKPKDEPGGEGDDRVSARHPVKDTNKWACGRKGRKKPESGIFLYTVHCHDKPGILEKATIQIWILKYLNVLYMCGSTDIIMQIICDFG